MFSILEGAAAGLVPGEHPAEPRTSIREPVLRSALNALMVLDALSDLAVVRSFLTAVCSYCSVWLNIIRSNTYHNMSAPVAPVGQEVISTPPAVHVQDF